MGSGASELLEPGAGTGCSEAGLETRASEWGDGAPGTPVGPREAPEQTPPTARGSAWSCRGSQQTTAGAEEPQRRDFPPDADGPESFSSPRLRTQVQAETF